MKPYATEYRHDGKRYGGTILATDWDDAEARLERGRVVGRIVATYRANAITAPAKGLWAVVRTAWMNWRGE